MPRPIRVLLQPVPLPGSALPFLVRGCVVGLQVWGPGASQAKKLSPSPAEIKFQLRCLKDGKDPTPIRTLDLGTVKGQVSLSKLGDPEFTIESTPDEPNEPVQVSSSNVVFQRSIQLSFRGSEFRNRPTKRVSLLVDEADLKDALHLELAATFDVSGGAEAADAVNDVLDVPLKLEFLALNLVDEVGEPLDAQSISLSYPEDEVAELTTDGEGKVRVQNPPGGADALLDFPAFDALRNELKQRWDKARNKPRLRPNRAVTAVSLKQTFEEEISLPPGVRTVSLQPRVELVRFVGLFFETNKCFVMPSAKIHLGKLRELYAAHPGSTLLVVGHADRAGAADYNDKLSLERAEAMASYLKDEASGFTKFYEKGVPEAKRWGEREDRLMLSSLPDGADLFASGDPIQAFRDSRGISETGPTGPATREALVTEYLAADEAKLPSDIELVSHGCGEHFPTLPTRDGVADGDNRRVELFFFSTGFGVQPAAPGKNSKAGSTAYPEWRRRAQHTYEYDLRLGETRLLKLRLLDSEHQPLAGMKWNLLHEFGSETGDTDGQGNLSVRIPARVESAVLVHDFGSIELAIDALPPPAEVLGTQLRLYNLGYECQLDGELGPDTQDALMDFQEDYEIEATGAMDEPTLAKLTEVYGQ